VKRLPVLELGAAVPLPGERLDVHDHAHVWTLPGDLWSPRRVQPLAAQLTQRVRASLAARPHVEPPAVSNVGVLHRVERRHDGVTGLGIEITIHPNHPV
jgi:hypothetical protein